MNRKYSKLLFLLVLIIMTIYSSIYIGKYIIETFVNTRYGLNRFDGIVFINLEKRRDRQGHICKMLKEYGVERSRIHKISASYIPKNGHKGCAQSHILALTLAKINNWENVLILEDDFIFTKDSKIVNDKSHN